MNTRVKKVLVALSASIAMFGVTTQSATTRTWTFENTTLKNQLSTVTGRITVDTSGNIFDPLVSYTIGVNRFYDTSSGGYGSADLSGPSNAHPTIDNWVVTNANEIDIFYGAKDRANPMMHLHLKLGGPTVGDIQVLEILAGSFFRFSPYVICDQCAPATYQEVTGNMVGMLMANEDGPR